MARFVHSYEEMVLIIKSELETVYLKRPEHFY